MTTVIDRANLLPTPYTTVATGAAPTQFSAYGTAGAVALTGSASSNGGRKAIRATVAASPATTTVGARSMINTNQPNVPEGKTFWFGADVYIPSSVTGTDLAGTFRDDPQNNSTPATFDAATPWTKPLSGIPRNTWTRVWWKATVKAGFTVTAVQLYVTGASAQAPASWIETTRWTVEIGDTQPTAPEYFDGGSPFYENVNETREFAWLGAPSASISAMKRTIYNRSLSLTWLDDQGAVRFEAHDMKPTDTVRMVGPNGRLILLRGYEDGTWHEGTTDGYGYHYEMPLGMVVTYCIADVEADYYDPATMANASIETPNNEAWLRDLVLPQLSQKVTVVSTDDEIRQGRQTLITIAGRSNPLSLYDIRLSRSGTITLLVVNDQGQGWGETSKEHMDALLYSGRPLLFSMCMSKGFQPLYMSANDVTYTKISSSTKTGWLAKINYQEVDNPTDVGLSYSAEVTWDMSRSMPVPNATYQQWKDSYPTFLDLVLDRPNSVPERDLG